METNTGNSHDEIAYNIVATILVLLRFCRVEERRPGGGNIRPLTPIVVGGCHLSPIPMFLLERYLPATQTMGNFTTVPVSIDLLPQGIIWVINDRLIAP